MSQSQVKNIEATECCKFSHEELRAVDCIKRWVKSLNKTKECCTSNIAISQSRDKKSDGSYDEKHTLICICDNEGPILRINKPVIDVTMEDILSLYKKINCQELKNSLKN